MHAYMHAHIRRYREKATHTNMRAPTQSTIHVSMNRDTHASIQPCIHTYIPCQKIPYPMSREEGIHNHTHILAYWQGYRQSYTHTANTYNHRGQQKTRHTYIQNPNRKSLTYRQPHIHTDGSHADIQAAKAHRQTHT